MSSDQDTIQKAETDFRREKDLDDYHNELMGNDVGRIQRFGFEHGRQEAAADEKRKKSAFEQMMFNEAYRAAWESAMDAVNRAENAVYEALIQASYDVSVAETSYNDLLDQATTTADGTKVFRDKDGNVYTEDGEPLPAEIAESLVWDDNAPTWEEYSASKEKLTNAQSRYSEVNAKSGRLVEIREELTDQNDPLSIVEIQAREQEATDIRNAVDQSVRHDVEIKHAQQPVIAPNLNLIF